jgi:tetratricopeptide (TPR) repeat protein
MVPRATLAPTMTPEFWQQLKPLFDAALERTGADRAAFIDAACADDAELKEKLVRLVEGAEEGTRTLDGAAARTYAMQEPRFYPGELILGRFRIVRTIGVGGMGEVYEAEDLQLGRIALKTIREGIATSSEAFDRFRQEVQLARKVSGQQVCRIHELYLLPAAAGHRATAFLTMEYLEGITLSAKLRKDGPLPLKQALRAALDICEGLRLVHEKGVIHRDLKSANIMLCGEGEQLRAVLMDFGLARDFSGEPASTAKAGRRDGTVAGAILGTPAYMAPEQFEGEEVSPATDIYALGIVLYELVTGLHPYAAPTPVAAAIRRAQRPALPSTLDHSVPRKWDRVIQRCLQYGPENRYQSASEVAKELRAGPADLTNLRQDRPWLFRAAVCLALAAGAWGVFIWWQARQYYHPGAEALRWYEPGIVSMREGNYFKATRLFQAAIDQDGKFVMAHARLAEAWYDLDFQGKAQRELLIAMPERRHLLPLEAEYLDAINATVMADFPGAVQHYNRILNQLPAADKSAGYVDLGKAYERTGDVTRALASYSSAVAADSNNPAAYMDIGVLQSRLHRVAKGDQAFEHARGIFTAETNAEGLAELDYERGYAANDRGDSKDAVPLLERAFYEAKEISSIQLEIRALSQLSSAESNSVHDAEAVRYAEQAIKLARDNQLQSWAANGLIRLADVQRVQLHYKEAEEPLNEAFEILRQTPEPRVEALANSTRASLMDQEHHLDKVAAPAQAALDYYKKNGFSEGASGALVLLTRAERNEGQYKQAMEDGQALLALEEEHGIPVMERQAEELVGSIYLTLEQYPDALKHFENARGLGSAGLGRSYQELHCAETLWKLGRYAESEEMFGLASVSASIAPNIGESRVRSLLSQQKYRPALELSKLYLADSERITPEWRSDFENSAAIAAAHLGMKKEALTGLAPTTSPDEDHTANGAQEKMTAAEIYLSLGMSRQAHDAAITAEEYFNSSGQRDSELQCAYMAAEASRRLRDEVGYQQFAKKTVDILKELRQTWGPEPFQRYIERPDLQGPAQLLAKTHG